MKTIRQFTFLVIAFGLLLLNGCKKETIEPISCTLQGTPNHPYAARYQRIQDDLLRAGVPGVSVTVISPEGTWTSGGGKADLGNNTALTPCHTLHIGSFTKVFTAATIMKLQEEGVININDKINRYIPAAITDRIANANEATIKTLLNHTSGIKEYSAISSILGILNLSDVKLSAEESLKYIYDKEADFEVGSDLLYSNSNYLLLGLVIKYATGRDANQVIQEKIIMPLNLSNTYVSSNIPNTLTRGYINMDNGDLMQDVTTIDNNAVGGADMTDGGIISNSYDLATFLRALLAGNLLSAASRNEMQQFLTITQDLGTLTFIKQYGLGLMRLDTDYGTAIGHYGRVYAFHSVTMYFPAQDVTVSIIANGYSKKISDVFNTKTIFNHLFQ